MTLPIAPQLIHSIGACRLPRFEEERARETTSKCVCRKKLWQHAPSVSLTRDPPRLEGPRNCNKPNLMLG
eukprot:235508-Chlamydomonas_euryale.AAC.2